MIIIIFYIKLNGKDKLKELKHYLELISTIISQYKINFILTSIF